MPLETLFLRFGVALAIGFLIGLGGDVCACVD